MDHISPNIRVNAAGAFNFDFTTDVTARSRSTPVMPSRLGDSRLGGQRA
jgi:hypothetical protein